MLSTEDMIHFYSSRAILLCGLIYLTVSNPFRAAAQQPANAAGSQEPPSKETTDTNQTGSKRVFGVLPNYRTVQESPIYTPISARRKLYIGSKDSFDYPLVFLAGGLAAFGQLTNQNPSFGQGVAGYARRLGTGYADQAIGNMMTESFFPILLHEDPRYFRRGYGSKWSRTQYALTRIFVTRTDRGGRRFNFSELLGNATGVAISNSYYPDNREMTDNVEKLGSQLAIDAFSQVLKEFWPDVKQRLFPTKHAK